MSTRKDVVVSHSRPAMQTDERSDLLRELPIQSIPCLSINVGAWDLESDFASP
jgi:hypothetical protein